MAVHESDREDLMKEATALRRRCELSLPDDDNTVIAGFHEDGRFSLFFGADPAFHFDDVGRLRRGFCCGDLYRTQGKTLARLTRHREAGKSHLLRHDLTPEELATFLGTMDQRLIHLQDCLQSDSFIMGQQIPATPSLIPNILNSLTLIGSRAERLAPAIKG
ncbi:hypothetical protein CA54_48820 [Symmachiella macrocystis]|uniref:Uncharacterized protein n=2 Tax=Symmachiella macrocystis TaxID=2527985 RepID=A0A5C6BCI0_9PLAN|nr:hypothetical protein CA54_48820 [Symmachiella macrocystis]